MALLESNEASIKQLSCKSKPQNRSIYLQIHNTGRYISNKYVAGLFLLFYIQQGHQSALIQSLMYTFLAGSLR